MTSICQSAEIFAKVERFSFKTVYNNILFENRSFCQCPPDVWAFASLSTVLGGNIQQFVVQGGSWWA